MLASLAYADAKHDFSATLAGYYFHTLQTSLPGIIELMPHEKFIVNHILSQTHQTMELLDTSSANRLFARLGGTPTKAVAIICDAGFGTKLMNILKLNTIGRVFAIINREQKNDPGTSTKYTDSFNLYVAEEVSSEPIEYSAYSEITADSHYVSSRFNIIMHSNYVTINGGTENIETSFDYQENKKDAIRKELELIQTNAKKDYERTLTEGIQTQVQMLLLQKRCGDWLQVLSCLDKNREYIIDGVRQNLKDAVVYFCSQDQVAIAYSVFLGINCIQEMSDKTSGITYRMYEGGNKELPLAMYKFRLHRDASLVNSQEHIRQVISTYDRLYSLLLPELKRIETASSISEIKECMKYALHLGRLISETTVIKHKRYILEAFLINPHDLIFDEESKQRTINNVLAQSFDKFHDLNIHAPIPDEQFALFDPSKFIYKASGNSSAIYILYGQAILSHMIKIEELQPFVKSCVEKICDLSDDSLVSIMYAVFVNKYFEDPVNMIGGSHSHEQLKDLGTIITQTLMYDYEFKFSFFEFQKKYFHKLYVISIGESIVESIILKHGIKVMMYLDYIEMKKYPEDMFEVYTFLKTPKDKRTIMPKKVTMLKTRKAVSRRRHRKYRKTRKLSP